MGSENFKTLKGTRIPELEKFRGKLRVKSVNSLFNSEAAHSHNNRRFLSPSGGVVDVIECLEEGRSYMTSPYTEAPIGKICQRKSQSIRLQGKDCFIISNFFYHLDSILIVVELDMKITIKQIDR